MPALKIPAHPQGAEAMMAAAPLVATMGVAVKISAAARGRKAELGSSPHLPQVGPSIRV